MSPDSFVTYLPDRSQQVVVQHRGEEFLPVDALAEAVRGDQHSRLIARHLGDALLAEIVRVLARHDTQVEFGELLVERRLKVLAEVVRRLDVTAEDYWFEAVFDPVLEDHRGGKQLLVVPVVDRKSVV